MTYKLCKKMITNGHYTKKDMLNKLDVFYATNRLTDEEYTELVNMINERE